VSIVEYLVTTLATSGAGTFSAVVGDDSPRGSPGATWSTDDLSDGNSQRQVARHRIRETPHSDTAERHLEQGSLQGSAELADDGSTGAKDENADAAMPNPANQGSSQFGNNCDPTETWDLNRLAEYIRGCLRRTAEDAWWIGQALELAHPQPADNREWLRWLKDIGISKTSAYRFCDLFRGYTLEEIQTRPGVAVDRLLNELQPDHYGSYAVAATGLPVRSVLSALWYAGGEEHHIDAASGRPGFPHKVIFVGTVGTTSLPASC
jgi:hypothetical protein